MREGAGLTQRAQPTELPEDANAAKLDLLVEQMAWLTHNTATAAARDRHPTRTAQIEPHDVLLQELFPLLPIQEWRWIATRNRINIQLESEPGEREISRAFEIAASLEIGLRLALFSPDGTSMSDWAAEGDGGWRRRRRVSPSPLPRSPSDSNE